MGVNMDRTMDRLDQETGGIARKVGRFPSNTLRAIPSNFFLWAAGISVAASALMQLSGKKHNALFLGEWPPTLVLLGVFHRLVKIEERLDSGDVGPENPLY